MPGGPAPVLVALLCTQVCNEFAKDGCLKPEGSQAARFWQTH